MAPSGVEIDRIGVTLFAVVAGVNVDDADAFGCLAAVAVVVSVADVGDVSGAVTLTSMNVVFVV